MSWDDEPHPPPLHAIYPDPALEARRRAADALRDLSEALVGHAADEGTLAEVARWARGTAGVVRRGPRLERAEDYQRRRYTDPPPPDGAEVLTFSDRPISGPANPAAFRMSIRRQGDEAVARVVFDRRAESSPGRAHGGMTAAVFDDVMGYVNVIDGVAAYTLELQVRYIAGMPLHEPVEVRARTVEVTGRRSTVTAEARVVRDGTLVGEARAVFALIPRDRL